MSDAPGGIRQLRSRLLGGEDEERAYACLDCGTRFAVEHFRCPECGCFSVERDRWAERAEE